MSTVHLLAVVQATVIVDTETRKVVDLVYDPESLIYEDPVIALDEEGGPVSDELRALAYDIAETDERDWHMTPRIGDVQEMPDASSKRRRPGELQREAKELAREIIFSESIGDYQVAGLAHEELIKLVRGSHNAAYHIMIAEEEASLNPQTCTREPRHHGPCNGYPRVTCPGYEAWAAQP